MEQKLEGWMGLEINRDKTKIISLKHNKSYLDFLGFTFRFERDLFAGTTKYLNVFPAKKSMGNERKALKSMTGSNYCFVPIPDLIKSLNRNLIGWSNYFNFGYPRKSFRQMNNYVRNRLYIHLNRRSQRRFKWPKDISVHKFFDLLGLIYL